MYDRAPHIIGASSTACPNQTATAAGYASLAETPRDRTDTEALQQRFQDFLCRLSTGGNILIGVEQRLLGSYPEKESAQGAQTRPSPNGVIASFNDALDTANTLLDRIEQTVGRLNRAV